MTNSKIDIMSVVLFNDNIVANIDFDKHLIFIDGVSEEIRQKVLAELEKQGIKISEREQ